MISQVSEPIDMGALMKDPKVIGALALLAKIKKAGAAADYPHYAALCSASGVACVSQEEFDTDRQTATTALMQGMMISMVPEEIGVTQEDKDAIIAEIKKGGGSKDVIPHIISVIAKMFGVPPEYVSLIQTVML